MAASIQMDLKLRDFFVLFTLTLLQLTCYMQAVNCQHLRKNDIAKDSAILDRNKRSWRKPIKINGLDSHRMLMCARLNREVHTVPVSTVDACVDYCQSVRRKYAAVGIDNCACYQRRTYSVFSRANRYQCNRQCSGNRRQNCGGDGGHNAIYYAGGRRRKQKTKLEELYKGCFINQWGEGDEDDSLTSDSMTPRVCINHCKRHEYNYGLLSKSKTCTCMNYVDELRTIYEGCGNSCSGNREEKCGGPNHQIVSLYQVSLHLVERY